MKSQSSVTIAKNSVANLARLAVSVMVAVLVPHFLTRRLSHDMYAAWVLILQLSAYAAIFELGLQSAISKFVAQHHATEDHEGTSSVVSTATALLLVSAAIALFALALLVWQVPNLFRQLAPSLVHQVRMGIVLVGGATALALPTTALASTFQGVQRYKIPMLIGGGSQVLTGTSIVIAVLNHASLIVMGACFAAITLGTGIVQVAAWRKYLSHVRVSAAIISRQMIRVILAYCASMSVWTFAMLLISGLDTTIVGHFDFKATGFYAVAATLTNFVILAAGSVFGPLLPAVSALAAVENRLGIASLTLRSTRYCVLLLVLTGLPLLLYGYPILSIWVGTDYARRSFVLLEILTIANMTRQCMLPYSIVLAGNGLQRYAWFATLTEATVNFVLSVALAHRFGAVGVAVGTLAGAVVGVTMLISNSMLRTRRAIPILRIEFLQELAKPLACAVPLFGYFLFCRGNPVIHGLLPPILVVILTAVLLWILGLRASDRQVFRSAIRDLRAGRALHA